MDIISLNHTATLDFASPDGEGSTPKAQLEITNKSSSQNAAFKIKTTAPKLFKVMPIQGIIAPGRTVSVEIMLQPGQIQTLADVYKNKFMVQATSTEL